MTDYKNIDTSPKMNRYEQAVYFLGFIAALFFVIVLPLMWAAS